MRHVKRILALLSVLALAASPALAFGATATPVPAAAASAPVATPANMQVLLWPSAAGALLIVGVEVPTSTPLPATVRVPLPAGATVTWVGELSGGSADTDPEREYTIADGTGGKVVVFRLEKYHSCQIEASCAPPQAIGGKTVSTLDWVQSSPSPLTHFAIQVGPEAANVTIDPASPGAPETSPEGESLYSVASKQMKPGDTFTMTVAYVLGAQAATPAKTALGGGTTALLVVLGVLLAAAITGFLVIAARMRRAEHSEVEMPTRDGDVFPAATAAPKRRGPAAPDQGPAPAAEDEPDADDPFRIDWE
jgi:hypothetical protein